MFSFRIFNVKLGAGGHVYKQTTTYSQVQDQKNYRSVLAQGRVVICSRCVSTQVGLIGEHARHRAQHDDQAIEMTVPLLTKSPAGARWLEEAR